MKNYCKILIFLSCGGCVVKMNDTVEEDIVHGTISYPFVDESPILGKDGPQDKFVIKSAAGGREYIIEIPGAARDYDVQVPLAELGSDTNDSPSTSQIGSTVVTDHEITNSMPKIDNGSDTALVDAAFGVGSPEGPRQNPSYTLGLAKINTFFKKHQFEYCLVELNNMIAFFPNAPQLHKMKGTILVKMRQLKLAELAWIKTLQLDPKDRSVRNALGRLQNRLTAMGQTTESSTLESDLKIPTPVGTPANSPPKSILFPDPQPGSNAPKAKK